MTDVLTQKRNPEVKAHIDMLQGIIGKMADNSKSCKQWCIAIETFIFTVNNKELNGNILISMSLVAILFMLQDAGYLYFSRNFRKQHSDFINKLNGGREYGMDIFSVKPITASNKICGILKALLSMYIWPYYLSIIVMTAIMFYSNK